MNIPDKYKGYCKPRVKEYRKKMGITQDILSVRSGVPVHVITRLENNWVSEDSPYIRILNLADTLNVSVGQLLGVKSKRYDSKSEKSELISDIVNSLRCRDVKDVQMIHKSLGLAKKRREYNA